MHDQISEDKKIDILRTKRTFSDETKSIFHHFKGLLLKQIKLTILVGESPTFTCILILLTLTNLPTGLLNYLPIQLSYYLPNQSCTYNLTNLPSTIFIITICLNNSNFPYQSYFNLSFAYFLFLLYKICLLI